MRRPGLIRTCFIAGVALIGVAVSSTQALAWGWAAHAYITGHLTKKTRHDMLYGSVIPDMFNYAFDSPCLSATMHDKMHNDSMPVWINALASHKILMKAAAFGVVAHNDVWGEDGTAHHDGITFGQGEGYVTAKAKLLRAILQQVPEFRALGVPDDVALNISQGLVEAGVDIQLARSHWEDFPHDPGSRLYGAAFHRNKKFTALLADTYAPALAECAGISVEQARSAIIYEEKQFRERVQSYAAILWGSKAVMVKQMSEQVAPMAGACLAAKGIALPEGTDLVPLVQFGIVNAVELCKDDYKAELDATVQAVSASLTANGVTY